MEHTEQTEKTYPPSASHGGNNAYYLKGCDVVGHQPSYAACLFKITEHRAGRTYPTHGACVEEIKSGRCKAVAMQQEEELKGVALYYFPRQVIQSKVITNLTPVSEIPAQPKPYKPLPVTHKVASVPDPIMPENGYAAAINAAMQEMQTPQPAKSIKEPEPPVEKKTPPAVKPEAVKERPTIQPGETPLQYARRIAEFNKQQTQLENV